MFLKYNQHFWVEHLVSEAVRSCLSEKAHKIIRELKYQAQFKPEDFY